MFSHRKWRPLFQIALLSQSITDTFSLDTDYHRDYTTDDLFNVEFYATGDLKHLLTTGLGHLMSVILVILTLAMTMITTLKVGSMSKKEMEEWCFACLYSFTVYIFVLEPLKCICYLALQCYTWLLAVNITFKQGDSKEDKVLFYFELLQMLNYLFSFSEFFKQTVFSFKSKIYHFLDDTFSDDSQSTSLLVLSSFMHFFRTLHSGLVFLLA